MALDVAGDRMLGPLPVLDRLGKKFELARRRRKANHALPSISTPSTAPFLATTLVAASTVESARSVALHRGFVDFVDVVFDQKGAVLAHVLERVESLLGRRLRASPERCSRRSSDSIRRSSSSRRARRATRNTCGCRGCRQDRRARTARSRTRLLPTPRRCRRLVRFVGRS